jgi:hypothetical protein
MIEINLQQSAYYELPFLNAAPGRRGIAVREKLPFLRAVVTGLPQGAPPIVATADLQGRSEAGETADTLLGCAVADALRAIQATGGLPAPETSLGLLAGDFYSFPNAVKRGGIGDVSEVWFRMSRRFNCLAGVFGNHDLFGEPQCPCHPPDELLDGTVRELAGLRIGGVSGIIGDPSRANRRSPDGFADQLVQVLDQRPDILLMHAAPQIGDGAPGEPLIAERIQEANYEGLIVCGHVHWRERVQRCGRAPVLNVDGAVVTLVSSG